MFQQVSFEERGKPAGVLLHSANPATNSEIVQSPDVQSIILAYRKLTPQEQLAMQHSAQLVAAATVGLSASDPSVVASTPTTYESAPAPTHLPPPASEPAAIPTLSTHAPSPAHMHVPAPASEPSAVASTPSNQAPVPAHIRVPAPASEPSAVVSTPSTQAPAPAHISVPAPASEPSAVASTPSTQAPAPAHIHVHVLAPASEPSVVACTPSTQAPEPAYIHVLAPASEPSAVVSTPSTQATEPAYIHVLAPASEPSAVASTPSTQAPAPAHIHVHVLAAASEPSVVACTPSTQAPEPAYIHVLAPASEPSAAATTPSTQATEPAYIHVLAPASEPSAVASTPSTHAPAPANTPAPSPAPPVTVGLSTHSSFPTTPNHLPHSTIDSINISGFEFLPPLTPPLPIPQRHSTPVERCELSNPLYEWSSPATRQRQPFDTRFCCEEVMRRLMTQEFEIKEFQRQQTELLKRIEALKNASIAAATSSPTCRSVASRRSQEIFSNRDLLRVKAGLFVVGRPLTSDYCKELVADLYENEPALSYDIDTLRAINDSKRCSDAPALSKYAVLELFSIGELAGRNCTGRSSTGSVDKLPLDSIKLRFIRESVLEIYPQRSEGARRDVWNKCVEKINSQLRYLFQGSLKKQPWLNIGL